MSGLDVGLGRRSETGGSDGRLLKGGLGESEKEGKASCRGGNDVGCKGCGGECLSASENDRGPDEKGEGRLEPGCILGGAGGYEPGLAP